MSGKTKLEIKSCIIIGESQPEPFENLSAEQRREYTEKIMERAGKLFSQYLSESPQEAENLFIEENQHYSNQGKNSQK